MFLLNLFPPLSVRMVRPRQSPCGNWRNGMDFFRHWPMLGNSFFPNFSLRRAHGLTRLLSVAKTIRILLQKERTKHAACKIHEVIDRCDVMLSNNTCKWQQSYPLVI